MATWAQSLSQQSGWRRCGWCFFMGALGVLAFPPIGFTPILFLSFPAFLLLLRGTRSDLQAFFVGWFFAFGYFVFNLYWIAASMFVDIAHFWWAVPLAVAGLPAFLSTYYGLAAVMSRRFGTTGISGALFCAVLWVLADYARGHLFTGFPWTLEAYAWDRILPVMQSVSVFGAYGLSLLTAIMVFLPAAWRRDDRRNGLIIVGSLGTLIVLIVLGELRLSHDTQATVDGVRVRLVQPNVDEAEKWKNNRIEDGFRQLIDLSTAAPSKADGKVPTHIIWPETASTFFLATDIPHRMQLASHMNPDTTVMTGVIRRDRTADGKLNYFNSLIAINDAGEVVTYYDKVHLVPFGEFMPMRSILKWRALVPMQIDFSSGDGAHSLHVKGLPLFSPFICYEAIFPGQLTDPNDRPSVLLNITNDGWYGNTSGPYQHFAIARMRAIEEGLPLLRAANTGISGVTDAYGRVTDRLGLGREGYIDVDLGQALSPTIFVHVREYPFWAMIVLLVIACAAAKVLRPNE